jgi:hypothetical protein
VKKRIQERCVRVRWIDHRCKVVCDEIGRVQRRSGESFLCQVAGVVSCEAAVYEIVDRDRRTGNVGEGVEGRNLDCACMLL